MTDTIPSPLADSPADEHLRRWYPDFADWLERQMPKGTVIGNPLWWASKIADYLAWRGWPAISSTPPAAPAPAWQGFTPEDLADVIRGDTLFPIPAGSGPEAIAAHLLQHPATGPLLRGNATPPAEGTYAPSIEQLGPLIAWLSEASCQAADAGRSRDAGMLCWAMQVISERVDEDAPDPGSTVPGSTVKDCLQVAPAAEDLLAIAPAAEDLFDSSWFEKCRRQDDAEFGPINKNLSPHRQCIELLHWAEAREARLDNALRRLMRWGGFRSGSSRGFNADVVLGVVDWLDGEMAGPLPPLPRFIVSFDPEWSHRITAEQD